MKPHSAHKSFWRLIHRTSVAWHNDKAQRLSAALSFYTIFSLAPMLVLLVLLSGFILGRQEAQAFLVGKLKGMTGTESADVVTGLLVNMRKPVPSIIAGAFGLLALFWGASTVFGCLADSLNSIWGAKRDGGRFGIKGFLKHRLLTFAMVVGTGGYLIISSIVTAGLAAVGAFLQGVLPLPLVVFQAIDFAGSVVAMTLLFAIVFKLVPAVKQQWSDTLPGALLTAVLFAVGKYLIGLYFVKTTVASAYGAAGSFVVLLLWIYFGAQIFFFGAEFNKSFMRMHGSGKGIIAKNTDPPSAGTAASLLPPASPDPPP
jgi:membrane protein